MFKFAMQPLLEFRKSIEEKMLLAFAGKARQLEIEKEKLERLRWKRSLLVQRFAEMQREDMNAGDIASLFSYLEHVRMDEQRQEDSVRKTADELDEKRKELLEAVKKRKVIEVLKEKQMKEYMQMLTRKELRRLDEFGIDQFKREEGQENNRRL
jgi:flagellar FliJ protein